MLEKPKTVRRKPTPPIQVAEVVGEPYTCVNTAEKEPQIAHPGEYVANPGTQNEYPIGAARLAELYEPISEPVVGTGG